jgi:hypothetical protein
MTWGQQGANLNKILMLNIASKAGRFDRAIS